MRLTVGCKNMVSQPEGDELAGYGCSAQSWQFIKTLNNAFGDYA